MRSSNKMYSLRECAGDCNAGRIECNKNALEEGLFAGANVATMQCFPCLEETSSGGMERLSSKNNMLVIQKRVPSVFGAPIRFIKDSSSAEPLGTRDALLSQEELYELNTGELVAMIKRARGEGLVDVRDAGRVNGTIPAIQSELAETEADAEVLQKRACELRDEVGALAPEVRQLVRKLKDILLRKHINQCELITEKVNEKIKLFEDMTARIYQDRLCQEYDDKPPESTCASMVVSLIESFPGIASEAGMSKADCLSYLTPDERDEYQQVLGSAKRYLSRLEMYRGHCTVAMERMEKGDDEPLEVELDLMEESMDSLLHEWSKLTTSKSCIIETFQALKADGDDSEEQGEELAPPVSKRAREMTSADDAGEMPVKAPSQLIRRPLRDRRNR